MGEQKKRALVSYENMSEELVAAFEEKYPRGAVDYLPDVQKIDKPDGTTIYTVTIEIPSAIYLVKVQIKVDDLDDVDKWLDEGDEEDSEGGDSDSTLPDDNISQYSGNDDDVSED